MTQIKKGIELGIKAPLPAIKKAASMADQNGMDYFFVPETNPQVMGVNAFDAIQQCSKVTENVTLGTGIVNVFSRDKSNILNESTRLYENTKERFILGIGTSAPIIVSKTYGLKFERPVSRVVEYTEFLRKSFGGPIYWAAVGPKMIKLATKNADGILFFLRPRRQAAKDIKEIRKITSSSFQVISIIPTFVDAQNGSQLARRTLAGYIGANEFYSKPLEAEGFDVSDIKKEYRKFGIDEASMAVSEELVDELTVFGSPHDCIKMINNYQKETGVNTVIAGFDLAKDSFNSVFFEKLAEFLAGWRKWQD